MRRILLYACLFHSVLTVADDRLVGVAPTASPNLCPIIHSRLGETDLEIAGFLDEHAASGDHTVLMVLADHLEEKGGELSEERSRFLRAQAELGRILDKYGVRRIDELPDREVKRAQILQAEVEGLGRHASRWVPDLPYVLGYEFRDGLLHGAVVDATELAWLSAGEMGKYLQSLQKAGVRSLDLSRTTDPDTLTILLAHPEMKGFTSLVLPGGVERRYHILSDSSSLSNVRNLSFATLGNWGHVFPLVRAGGLPAWQTMNDPALRGLPELARQSMNESTFNRQADALNRLQQWQVPFNPDETIYPHMGPGAVKALGPTSAWPVLRAALATGGFRKKIVAAPFGEVAELYDLARESPETQKELVARYLEYHRKPLDSVVEWKENDSAFARALVASGDSRLEAPRLLTPKTVEAESSAPKRRGRWWSRFLKFLPEK